MKYKLRYSDGQVTERTFDTEKEAQWFIHNEGDHLLEATQVDENDIVYRLNKRAEIRRQIPTRKSVQEGANDRIADLLEEAAAELTALRETNKKLMDEIVALEWQVDDILN